jgi:hypothetical protein
MNIWDIPFSEGFCAVAQRPSTRTGLGTVSLEGLRGWLRSALGGDERVIEIRHGTGAEREGSGGGREVSGGEQKAARGMTDRTMEAAFPGKYHI